MPHEGNNAASRREAKDLHQQAARIEEIIDAIEQLPDDNARRLMQECIQSVMGLHGHALKKILDLASESGSAGTNIHDALIHDPTVRGILLIHDIHPQSIETRLREALDKVLPYIHSHGGDVELVGIAHDVATIRLKGTCQGCPSSAVTLELAVKNAIAEACPDLAGLQVEGMPAQSMQPDLHAPAHHWTIIDGALDLPDGAIKPYELSGHPFVICKYKGRHYAYQNICPSCDVRMDTGIVKDGLLLCGQGHGFEIEFAGGSRDQAGLHLQPFPLLVENDQVKVAV